MLYDSLQRAQREGVPTITAMGDEGRSQTHWGKMYPFGPGCLKSTPREHGASLVYITPHVPLMRYGKNNEWVMGTSDDKEVEVSVISAAAPNLNSQDTLHRNRERQKPILQATINQILVTPLLLPACATKTPNVLILGAFGSGSFGWDGRTVAKMFVKAIKEFSIQQFYDEIVFAIPRDYAESEANCEAFQKVLLEHGLWCSYGDQDDQVSGENAGQR